MSQTPQAGPLATDLNAFRAELRAYLASGAVDEYKDSYLEDVHEELRHNSGLLQKLYAAGFGKYGVPPEVGGLGGDVRHWAALYDELSLAGLPLTGQHALLTTLTFPIVHFAPELAAKYLPEFLSGEKWWGQGFSESEAGSDMASMRCRATREGDDYIVSGHKLWTSNGYTASRVVTLVRTGTPESRHKGISMLLIDADMPGVTIRPIALSSGREELAECFFDDVRVPADRLIGAENAGWSVAMYLLQFERALWAWLRAAALTARLRSLLAELPPQTAASDEAHRTLGSFYLDLVALRARSVDTVRRLAAGETVGPEASTDKLLLGAAEQSMYDAARTLFGESFVLGEDAARWREEWWYSRTTTIYGGSAEVQRGIIADRVLGLPKE